MADTEGPAEPTLPGSSTQTREQRKKAKEEKKRLKAAAERRHNVRKWFLNVLALSIAAIIGAAAASRLPSDLYSKIFHPHVAPVVTITSVQWPPGRNGLFVVKGTATNVSPGQLLYTFNQPVTKNVTGIVYPGSSPCAIQSNGTFDCENGFAGGAHDTGQDFNISAAIVAVAQAYGFGQEEVGIGQRPSSLALLPHVAGPDALASKEVTRTN